MSAHHAMSEYRHTQRGWFHYLLYGLAGVLIAAPWFTGGFQWPPAIVLWVAAAVAWALAGSMQYLVVQGEADHLLVRYGPVPLFHKRILYRDITDVEPGHIALIDGWGIHWVPRRGWTYNIAGWQCVKLRLGRRTIRIGTDEPEELAAFLRKKIAGRRV